MVSSRHVGGTRGSSIVSSAADVLWMSVVRGMRGVDGVCEMCMCLARGGVGGEGVSGLSLGLTNPVGTGRVLDVSVFGLRWCGWYRWGVDRGIGSGSGGVVLCLCELRVRILCVDGRSRYLYIVLG